VIPVFQIAFLVSPTTPLRSSMTVVRAGNPSEMVTLVESWT